MPTPRERAREQTLADITRLGREQLAEVGAANLSVRSIARDLGVVSSAVYRYVRSRDDLLTLLVVDAYEELGDRADAAVARRKRADHVGRFRAASHAVRDWALAEPARYALLFGSPVPGYAAPGEQTIAPGTRVPVLYAAVLAAAWADGGLTVPDARPLPQRLANDLVRAAAEVGADVPPAVLASGLLAWTSVFGAVSFELFGQYGPDTFAAPKQLFDHHLDRLQEVVGLVPPPGARVAG